MASTAALLASVLAAASAATAAAVGSLAPDAAAEVRLVPPTSSLRPLHPARATPRAARADLASALAPRLAALVDRAAIQTVSAAGGGLRVRADAFVLGSARSAARVLAVWRRRRHDRPIRLGSGGAVMIRAAPRRAIVTVAWREHERIGVLALTVTNAKRDPRTTALGYALLTDSWLRSPLPRTAWQQVLTQIRPDGTVSKRTAEEAFEVAYRRLPGVSPPPGSRSAVQSGTLAAQWILSYWRQLTTAQRRVVARALGVTGPGPGAGRGQARAHATDYGDPGFHQDPMIQGLADTYVSMYTSRLGHVLGLKVVAGESTEPSAAYADTTAVGTPLTCRIRVLPPGQKVGQQQKLPFVPPLDLIVAHEVFHCFQGDITGWKGNAAWITEGMADWAALSVDPVPFVHGGGNLNFYIGTPHTSLFQRAYDAVGFWGHSDDDLPNLWARIPAILNAGSNEGSFALADGTTDSFLSTWGSSVFRAGGQGAPWEMHSPIEPPGFGSLPPPYQTIDASGMPFAPVDAAALSTSQYFVMGSAAEPLLHVSIAGHARLGLSTNYTNLDNAWFCVGGAACVCPKDTVGEVPPTLPLANPAALGVSGDPESGTHGDLSSFPLSAFCHPNKPTPTPSHGSTGVSNGDPYITTFDGAGYGFQTAGEFTLAKSTTDNLEIQSRQVPYPFKTFPEWAHSLAMNTAFAMRDGGATVEVDKGSPLVLYIDHHRRRSHANQTISLPGGGRVSYGARTTTVTWRDGTRARVLSIGDEGVNIAVTPSPARAGLLRGVLGVDDGHPADDFVGRDGRRYDATQIESVGLYVHTRAELRILLGGFGRTWRITQRQSLFVYPRGKTTRSYLVRGFPRVPVSLRSLPSSRRRAAIAACRRAHVTNQLLLAGCEIDVGATGSRLLATSTGTLQRTAGIRGTQTPPSGVSVSRVAWTQLSAGSSAQPGPPSVATAAGRVVAAYRRNSDQAIEAATFAAGSSGVAGVSRTLQFTGWQSTVDPTLLPAPGGNLELLLAGLHSTDSNDPLTGTVIAPRQADGSFGPSTRLLTSFSFGATSATLAADGSTPLWVSTEPFALHVFSGSVEHDLAAASPGDPSLPILRRDNSGRVWLAWYVFSTTGGRSGLYMMQLDPQTGAALGPAIRAPGSDAGPPSGVTFAMPCAQTCRLLYVGAGTAGSEDDIYSWAPGEPDAVPIVAGLFAGHQHSLDRLVGAYTSDGRLWVGFTDPSPGTEYAALGDVLGRGGQLTQLPVPPGFTRPGFRQPEHTVAVTIGDRLVLVTQWQNGSTGATSEWATVVNAR